MPPAGIPGADGVRVKNGQRLSLLLVYGQGSELARNATLAVQQDLRPVGVEVAAQRASTTPALYAAAQSGGILNGGKFDIAVYSWISGADPGQLVAVDVRDDSAGRQQRLAVLLAGDGRGPAAGALDVRPDRPKGGLRTDRIAARARRSRRVLLLSAPGATRYTPRLHHFQPNGISEGWNAQDWTLTGEQ